MKRKRKLDLKSSLVGFLDFIKKGNYMKNKIDKYNERTIERNQSIAIMTRRTAQKIREHVQFKEN
jgi:hypothetical protein